MWPLSLCLAPDFPVLMQPTVNMVLGGGSCTSHVAGVLTHMEHLSPSEVWSCMHSLILPVYALGDCHSCSDPIHQEVAWRTTSVLLRSVNPRASWFKEKNSWGVEITTQEMPLQSPQCSFHYGNFGAPDFNSNLVLGIFELKTTTGRLQKILSTKNQLLRYLRINLVHSKAVFPLL